MTGHRKLICCVGCFYGFNRLVHSGSAAKYAVTSAQYVCMIHTALLKSVMLAVAECRVFVYAYLMKT